MTRFLLTLAPLALLGAAPLAEAPAPPPVRTQFTPTPETCEPVTSYAPGDGEAPMFKRLSELPPGETYMAVFRRDQNGCIDLLPARDRQEIRQP